MNAPRPTHLRDARLRHALAHAPDAQAAPAEATRAAILRHAHAAVATPAPAPSVPWWTRLAQALAGPRRPWNAGFATVLLACVVAGLWWERDVPGPAPDAQRPAPAAAVPAPVAPQPPEHQESTAPADQPGAGAMPQPREQAPPAPRPARPLPAPAMPQAEPVAPPSPAETRLRARAPSPRAEADDAPAAPASAPPAAGDAADSAAARASRALAAGPSRPDAAPALDAFAWTALQLQPAPVRARDSLPADVLQAIDGLLRTGATAVPADDPVLARIALLHEGGAVLGVLELGAYSMRWVPAGDRLPRAFAARVEPAASQRIRDALAR